MKGVLFGDCRRRKTCFVPTSLGEAGQLIQEVGCPLSTRGRHIIRGRYCIFINTQNYGLGNLTICDTQEVFFFHKFRLEDVGNAFFSAQQSVDVVLHVIAWLWMVLHEIVWYLTILKITKSGLSTEYIITHSSALALDTAFKKEQHGTILVFFSF